MDDRTMMDAALDCRNADTRAERLRHALAAYRKAVDQMPDELLDHNEVQETIAGAEPELADARRR